MFLQLMIQAKTLLSQTTFFESLPRISSPLLALLFFVLALVSQFAPLVLAARVFLVDLVVLSFELNVVEIWDAPLLFSVDP